MLLEIHPGYLPLGRLVAEASGLDARCPGVGVTDVASGERHETPAESASALRRRLLRRELRLREVLGARVPASDGDRPFASDSRARSPGEQLRELRASGAVGRIPAPALACELWAQHKHSVLARDPSLARTIGRELSRPGARSEETFDRLAELLTRTLSEAPVPGRAFHALQRLWGHVSKMASDETAARCARLGVEDAPELLDAIVRLASARRTPYVVASTALSDIAAWLESPACR